MADPNKLRITKNDQGIEVLVSDAEGNVHDITAKFRDIVGTTSPASIQNTIGVQDNGTTQEIHFSPKATELNYELGPETSRALSALAQ